jgi:hypothetical protein
MFEFTYDTVSILRVHIIRSYLQHTPDSKSPEFSKLPTAYSRFQESRLFEDTCSTSSVLRVCIVRSYLQSDRLHCAQDRSTIRYLVQLQFEALCAQTTKIPNMMP